MSIQGRCTCNNDVELPCWSCSLKCSDCNGSGVDCWEDHNDEVLMVECYSCSGSGYFPPDCGISENDVAVAEERAFKRGRQEATEELAALKEVEQAGRPIARYAYYAKPETGLQYDPSPELVDDLADAYSKLDAIRNSHPSKIHG